MPYRADGKALLQPVPAPAHFCIRQTNPWVRKNSAQRVTDQPRVSPSRDVATQLFTSRKNLDGKRRGYRNRSRRLFPKQRQGAVANFGSREINLGSITGWLRNSHHTDRAQGDNSTVF